MKVGGTSFLDCEEYSQLSWCWYTMSHWSGETVDWSGQHHDTIWCQRLNIMTVIEVHWSMSQADLSQLHSPSPSVQIFILIRTSCCRAGSLQQYYSRYDILCHVSQEYQHHSCTSSSVSPYWVDTPVHSTVVSWPQCQVTHVSLEYSDPSPGCGDNTGHHQHHASCQTILNTLHTTPLTQLFMSWVKLSVTPILLGTTFSASMVQL